MASKATELHRSMTHIHTWAGVVVASILFAVFWTGTLTIFDKEIDRWMQPSLRLPAPVAVSLDEIVAGVQERAPEVTSLSFAMPTPRRPALDASYSAGDDRVSVLIDPATGEVLPTIDTLGGSDFFFTFHHNLLITWAPFALGTWITSLAAVGMLMLIITGIVIHKKLIVDFFTLRPARKRRRLLLDLHNLSSMVALPFHILLPLTALIINFGYFLPIAAQAPAAFATASEERQVESPGRPAPMQSIDALVRRAEAEWSAADGTPAKAQAVTVQDWGDANARLTVAQRFPGRSVSIDRHRITFAGASGEVVDRASAGPMVVARKWLEGFHWMQWDHVALRWLMFIAGLLGCVMIATGLLFWLESRRKVHGEQAASWRAVQALTIGSTTGLIVASGAFLIANRLLPLDATFLGEGRATLEVWAFFFVWIACCAHAVQRGSAGWADQAIAIAVAAIFAAGLNALTTGDHILGALARGQIAVASIDLILLATAAIAFIAARRLRGRPASVAPSARMVQNA